MPFVILPTNSASGGYDITNSLRFNSGSTDYLTKASATPTLNTKGTFSCWHKRSNLGGSQTLYSGGTNVNVTSSTKDMRVYIDSNYLEFYQDDYDVTGNNTIRFANNLLRDVSAWYHIVVAVDTGQATNADKVKAYINGTQLTATTVSLGESFTNLFFNTSGLYQHIGTYNYDTSVNRLNGYMSDVFFIDGQQLTPSSFGETDSDTGIWKPKAFSGTYGTNGFYLQFKNSASLGTDSSGNGNTFTVNNLTSVDQSTDTPTNNFATLNSILYSTSISYTEGNLKFTNTSAGGQRMVASSIAPTTGKWYAECRVTSLGGAYPQVGVLDTSIYTMDTYVGALARGYGYASHGQVYNNAGALTTGLATYTNNDIIGVALDLTNNYVYFSKNGTFINSGVPTSGSSGTGGWAITDGYDYSFGSSSLDSGTDPVFDWNFGSPFYSGGSNTDGAGYGNFSYSVPSGYYSLCTRNLANFG
jgi:hypothetical protein